MAINERARQQYWSRVEATHAPESYAFLDAAYRQPHRAYHTWEHIDTLLEGLERFESLATRPDLVATAVFWHDAVHLPVGADGKSRVDSQNVRDSVAAFHRHTLLGQEDAAAVHDLVMATADHAHARPDTSRYAGFVGDFVLFVDLDLSPLAANWDEFAANTRKIQTEAVGVGAAEFAAAQAAMLEGIAKIDPIFRRDETRAEWESAARANLARCIPRLRGAGR